MHTSISRYILSFIASLLCFSGFAQAASIENESVLISAEGFELKKIEVIDEQGISRTVELYYIQGPTGVENAYRLGGLPLEEKEELEQEIEDDTGIGPWMMQSHPLAADDRPNADSFDTWVIDRRAVNLQSEEEAQNYLDELGIEPDLDDDWIARTDEAEAFGLRGCFGWKDKTKSYSKSINKSFDHDHPLGGANAHVDFSGVINLKTDLDIGLHYKYKRKFCVPYKFRVRHIDLRSDYDISGDLRIDGFLKHSIDDKQWKIAEPKLLDNVFFIGPVPVRLALKLPIKLGTGDIDIMTEGNIAAEKPLRFKGHFDYTCTTHRCTKNSANHQNLNQDLTNTLGGGVSAKLNFEPYAEVAAKGIVYHELFLYAQVGVKPSFPIEVFGYLGNLCDDGNNDGTNETVKAGLGTLDFKVGLTGEAKVFDMYILKPNYWKLWQKGLLFFDFLNPYSTALSPVLRPKIQSGNLDTVELPINIRSCVSSMVSRHPQDYIVNWGDGSTSRVNDISSAKTVSHQYVNSGTYTVKVSSEKGAFTEYLVSITSTPW